MGSNFADRYMASLLSKFALKYWFSMLDLCLWLRMFCRTALVVEFRFWPSVENILCKSIPLEFDSVAVRTCMMEDVSSEMGFRIVGTVY